MINADNSVFQLVCGEQYTVSTKLNDVFDDSCITFESARSGDSVYAEPQIVSDCLVSLARGKKVALTTSSVVGKIKPGDNVVRSLAKRFHS